MVNTPNPRDTFLSDPLVQKMINLLTRNGKKSKAEKIFHKLFFLLQKGFPGQALEIFYLAIFNAQSLVGNRVKPRGKKFRRAVAGKESFIPHFFSNRRSQTLAIRCIVMAAKERLTSKSLPENLSQEIINTALNRGDLIKTKYNNYIQAGLNRRFYRFRWQRSLPL